MSNDSAPSAFKLVLVPAIITLLVTAARTMGEVQGWIENKEAGGGGVPIGITWLILIFGFWFGAKLTKNGKGPGNAGKAALLHVGILVLLVGWFLGMAMGVYGADMESTFPSPEQFQVIIGGAFVIGLFPLFIWGAAFRTNLLYGLLARIPVIVVVYLDKHYGWETHYAKFPPGSEANSLPPMEGAFAMGMAQIGFWIPATIILGGLCASLGAMLSKKK